METLIVGASGATGKWLVEQLLLMNRRVKAIVRPGSVLPEAWTTDDRVTVIRANVSQMSAAEMAGHVKGCEAAASCLGHNMTLQGMFGKPRRLVRDAVQLICEAIRTNAQDSPVRVVLMNTAGNRNRDLDEPVSFGQRLVLSMLRLFLPPHADNEQAADYLRLAVGQHDPHIQWAAVRPDSLIDEDHVSDYEVHASPVRSALTNAGKTSRINVGHFMARLIADDDLWAQWRGQMPVIYNKD